MELLFPATPGSKETSLRIEYSMIVDVIILSRCLTREDFEVNQRCVQSLSVSEPDIDFRILIIESGGGNFAETGRVYEHASVSVIIPDEPFRFHRFLNIGLNHSRSEWVVFSNNDVIFHAGWFSEILKLKAMDPRIQSFCPFDRNAPFLPFEKFSQKAYHLGYRVPIEFVGWCFVVERGVFQKMGMFDERYDLYFGDNDFARTLKRKSVLHAMVPSSYVEHLGGYTTKKYDAVGTPEYERDKERYKAKWGDTRFRSFLYAVASNIRRRISS